MTKNIAITWVIAAALAAPVVAYANEHHADRDHPKTFVRDSKITTKVKARLAEEHIGSLAHVHVDTDAHGVVYLRGHVRTREQLERATTITRETEGVTEVKNHLTVKADD